EILAGRLDLAEDRVQTTCGACATHGTYASRATHGTYASRATHGTYATWATCGAYATWGTHASLWPGSCRHRMGPIQQ
ncbi:hypothetical protein P7K49_038889, partial [Saguinus oedipus]